MSKIKYWLGKLPERDDFGNKYTDVMYDARTKRGPWANMSETSWRVYGLGKLGEGYGQRYVKTADGMWMCVEG